jgi:hypothetical protein
MSFGVVSSRLRHAGRAEAVPDLHRGASKGRQQQEQHQHIEHGTIPRGG